MNQELSLAIQCQQMREALIAQQAEVVCECKNCMTARQALATPDNAEQIVARHDAALLRDASLTFHCRAKSGKHDGVVLSEEAVNACMYARVQLNFMANELEAKGEAD